MSNVVAFESGCEGWFKVRVLKRGRVVKETGWFRNLILNQGLDAIGQRGDWLAYCHVGTGNTAPANGQTGLVTYVSGILNAASSTGVVGAPDYYAYNQLTYNFNTGAVVGNMAELGIGWAISGNNLFSRSLILDNLGNPTTISVLADEQLQVIYQFRQYPPLTDVTGNITISGTNYSYTIRAAMVGTYSNNISGSDFGWGGFGTSSTTRAWIAQIHNYYGATAGVAAITSRPTLVYSAGGGTTFSNETYTVGNYYRDHILFVPSTNWNGSGNPRTIVIGYRAGWYQVEFDPTFAKTTLNSLTLTFRESWARRP